MASIKENASKFGSWLVENNIAIEDFIIEKCMYKLCVLPGDKSIDEVDTLMRQAKVLLYTLGTDCGVPMEGVRVVYKTVDEEEYRRVEQNSIFVMLRLYEQIKK